VGAAVTRRVAFGLGLTLGALVSPLAQLLAARYAGRHWLDITTKENR
jgi:hypothetical protein